MSTRTRQRQPLTAWLLNAFFVLIALPALWPIGSAVGDLEAWRQLLAELPRLWQLFETTALFAAGVLALTLPAGTVVALALFRLDWPGRSLVRSALFTAAFCPLILYAAGWQAAFGPYGFWEFPLSKGSAVGGMPAAILIHSLAALPWVAGVIGVGLTLMRPEWEEVAALDQAPGRVLLTVTLPMVRPVLTAAALLAVVPVLTEMAVTDLFIIRTLAEEVYTQFDAGEGDKVATLLTLPISAAAALFIAWSIGRWLGRVTMLPDRPSLFRIDASTAWLWLLGVAILMTYVLPIAGIVRQLGLQSTAPGALAWSWADASTYLGREMSDGAMLLLLNLASAGVSGLLTTALAVMLAWRWRWGGRSARAAVALLTGWLFVLPGPVLALGFIEIFNRPGVLGEVYDSPIIVIYGQVLRTLPYATVLIGSVFHLFDARVLEAAALEGATGSRLLFSVVLPATRNAILMTAICATALAMTELPVAKMLAPPGSDYLVLRLFHLLHTGTGNQQAALCILLLGTVGGLCLAGTIMMKRGGRREEWE